MTTYNVHLYREMRLVYGGIEAGSHEQAAAIARDRPTDQADSIDDCEGESIAALVDVQGDEEYEESRTIDFEPERERQAAPKLLAALKAFVEADALAEECGEWKWENLESAFELARGSVAEAEAVGIAPQPPAEPACRVTPRLLAALEYALEFLEANDDGESDVVARLLVGRSAIAEAKAAGIAPGPSHDKANACHGLSTPDLERGILRDLIDLANQIVLAKDHDESIPVDIYHAAARLLARCRS